MPTKEDKTLGTGAFIKSEATGERSRDVVTLASGQGVIVPGTVLGKVTASGNYVLYDDTSADGRGVATAIAYGTSDTTSGNVKAVVITRDAEVFTERLTWIAGATQTAKNNGTTDLAGVGVILRT